MSEMAYTNGLSWERPDFSMLDCKTNHDVTPHFSKIRIHFFNILREVTKSKPVHYLTPWHSICQPLVLVNIIFWALTVAMNLSISTDANDTHYSNHTKLENNSS